MKWLREHSVTYHLLSPLWLRIPERRRWDIVHWLNKSRRYCWSDLVTAALGWHEQGGDACDTHLPRQERAPRCASVCDYMHETHIGEHACSCYCGKFQFLAADGAIDRKRARA